MDPTPTRSGASPWRNVPRAVVVTAALVGLFAVITPSAAQVISVRGEAYGYRLVVSLFGGPNNVRGAGQVACTAPNTPPG